MLINGPNLGVCFLPLLTSSLLPPSPEKKSLRGFELTMKWDASSEHYPSSLCVPSVKFGSVSLCRLLLIKSPKYFSIWKGLISF